MEGPQVLERTGRSTVHEEAQENCVSRLAGKDSMRKVRHLGGRTVAVDANPVVLAALPVLRGETMRFLDFEFYGCEQADEPPEQPRLVSVEIGYVPGMLFQGTIDTTSLEAAYRRVLGTNLGTEQGLGGDPNPSADEAHWLTNAGAVFGGRIMWRKEMLTIPMGLFGNFTNVSGTGTTTPETKHYFKTGGTLKGGTFRDAGIIMAVFHSPNIAAQTDFGVAEADDQQSLAEVYEALRDGNVTADTDAAKLQELLFGGDTYIEADTVKEFAGRVYFRCTAGFTGVERVARRLRR